MNAVPILYSVVIPVYNESSNIAMLYERLTKTLEGVGGAYEIIFVDDGSRDNSYELLKDRALTDHAIRVISFARNFGQHKAVVAGMMDARGGYVVTLDADLQNPPEEIPKLLAKISEGFDMVSGYRKARKDTVTRKLCSSITNVIIVALCGLRMRDYGSMLRVFRQETAKDLADVFARNEGYITMLVAKVTRNVAEVEVSHDERYAGASKYTLSKLLAAFFKIFCYNDTFYKMFANMKDRPLFVIGKRIEDGKESVVTA